MLKKNGAVLGITVTFMIAFIMIGLGSVYFSGAQALAVQKRVWGRQAFWVAEGGVQKGIQYVYHHQPQQDVDPFNTGTTPPSLGEGSYVVPIHPISSVRWQIDSTGTVNGVNSVIRVIVGPNVMKAFTTTAPDIDSPGSGGIDDHIDPDGSYATNANLNFVDTFKMEITDMQGLPDSQTFTNTKHNASIEDVVGKHTVVEHQTIINQGANDTVSISDNNWTGSGVLVINGGTFQMQGGHFSGVIWIEGGCVKIVGDERVTGAVFVNDPNIEITRISGNSAIDFSVDGGGVAAVDAAFANLELSRPGTVNNVLSWRELR